MDFLSKPEVVSLKFEIALGSLNDKKRLQLFQHFYHIGSFTGRYRNVAAIGHN